MDIPTNAISVSKLTKRFGRHTAVDDVSIDVPRGCFATLLGPSGCGKTTLLRLIAGFCEPDAGEILLDGRRVNGLPPQMRDTPLVFQDYALFPHMTAFDNIAYGLRLRRLDKAEIDRRVDETMAVFGLEGMGRRYPKQMSGGQQQRVAFARAFVMGQKILLLDEPLSNLDAKLRVEVREELCSLQRRLGITTLYVTHDQDEALAMSDLVAVFERGRISQLGTPQQIYFAPANHFVAGFVGAANLLDADICGVTGNEITAKKGDTIYRIARKAYAPSVGDKVTLLIRPEHMTIADPATIDAHCENAISGEIQGSSFMGRSVRYSVRHGSDLLTVDDPDAMGHGAISGNVVLSFHREKVHLLPGDSSK